MLEKDDWRLMGQERFLSDKELLHRPYEIPQEDWDHDHCAFCSDKIDETTGSAYCTTDKCHWICEECFEDFREMFHWTVAEAQA